MKRLLTLVVVLSLATAANAAIVQLAADGSTDGAGIVTNVESLAKISVMSDTDYYAYDAFLAITDGTYGDFGTVTKEPKAGEQAVVNDFGAYGPYDHIVALTAADTTDPFNSVLKGEQFWANVTYTGTTSSQVLRIDLLDASLNWMDAVEVAIPEPATLALLGLGGLLLRRRR